MNGQYLKVAVLIVFALAWATAGAGLAIDLGTPHDAGTAWQCGYLQAMHDRERIGPQPSALCRQFQRMAYSR